MARVRKPARYPGKFETVGIRIANCPAQQMRDKINELAFVGYEVEDISDGRKVCITKPGGKFWYGRMQVNDFMVWVYDPQTGDRWRISHDEIGQDIGCKLAASRGVAVALVRAMVRVCEGEDPSDLGRQTMREFEALPGFPAELILKVYKWIWVQEDCNYPTGEGRWRSMNAILEMAGEPKHEPAP